MKKLFLALSFATILVSCKKEKDSDFTATDVTGTSVIKGNVSKNVITPNGSGNFVNTSRIPAKGISVTVKINKNDLYPNSNAQGADIYSATTDSLGNYSVSVRTNADGVNALVTIDGFSATLDTLINGVTKPGLYSTFGGTSQNVYIVMGQSYQLNHNFTASNVSTNPNNIVIGSAIITGSIGMSVVKEFSVNGFPISYGNEVIPVPAGHVVYLNFSKDPTLLAAKLYTTTTAANGYYTFNIATVAQGTSGFNQNANIWINDFATTRDTIKLGGTMKAGPAGVFQMESSNQFGVYNSAIRNANHMTYSSFVNN